MFDERIATLLAGGISISLASRGPGNRPNLTRGIGCRVPKNRRQITVFILASHAPAFLEDVRTNGAVAVVFSKPSTHHSWQFKGTDVRVAKARAGDVDLVAAYQQAFVEEVVPLGFREDAIRTLLAFTPEDIVGITFTPTSAFIQTPGLSAGEPLRDSV